MYISVVYKKWLKVHKLKLNENETNLMEIKMNTDKLIKANNMAKKLQSKAMRLILKCNVRCKTKIPAKYNTFYSEN